MKRLWIYVGLFLIGCSGAAAFLLGRDMPVVIAGHSLASPRSPILSSRCSAKSLGVHHSSRPAS